jgi:hypothetical protein
MKAMDVLLDADDLARFANLETDEDAASFQRRTTGRDTGPDFAPATWWNYRATDSNGRLLAKKQWQFTQGLVREAWDQQFQSEVGLFDLARLLLSVFDPEDLLENLIPIPSNAYRPRYADVGALAEEQGFHMAIRYLAGGPSWRLKKCENENCGRRFVADHNERKCCSTQCSSEHQTERQKKWGQNNNWGRPVKAKMRKSSPRVPGSRRKKATAKP